MWQHNNNKLVVVVVVVGLQALPLVSYSTEHFKQVSMAFSLETLMYTCQGS